MKRFFTIALVLVLLCSCVQAESLFERNTRIKERAQKIVNLIYDEEYDAVAAEFGEQMALVATAEDVRALWEGIRPYLGEFVERQKVNCNILQGYANVGIRDEFENYALELSITFDSQDKLFGIDMKVPDFEWTGSGAAVYDDATMQYLLEESLSLSDALLAGDYEKIVSRLSADIIGTLDAEMMAGAWTKMAPLMGDYVQRGEVHTEIIGDYFAVFVPEEFSQRTMNVQFVWNGRFELSGFHFRSNFEIGELPQ